MAHTPFVFIPPLKRPESDICGALAVQQAQCWTPHRHLLPPVMTHRSHYPSFWRWGRKERAHAGLISNQSSEPLFWFTIKDTEHWNWFSVFFLLWVEWLPMSLANLIIRTRVPVTWWWFWQTNKRFRHIQKIWEDMVSKQIVSWFNRFLPFVFVD